MLERWCWEDRAKDRPVLVKCRLTLTHCSMSSCVLVPVWAEMATEASEGVDGEKEGRMEGGREGDCWRF